MNTTENINSIKYILNNIFKTHQNDVISDIDRKSIFENILELYSAHATLDEQMEMMYNYSYYQKALNEYRKDNLNLGDYYITKVGIEKLNINDKAKKSMEVLYYPAYSYKFYKSGDYNNALTQLDLGIEAINAINDNLINEHLIKARLEQTYNKFKIFIQQKNQTEITRYATLIITHLLSNTKNEIFPDDIAYDENVQNEWNTIKAYYIDNIITLTAYYENTENKPKGSIVNKVLKKVKDDEQTTPKEFINFIQLIDTLSNQQATEHNNIDENELEKLSKTLPDSLKYLFLIKAESFCKNQNIDIAFQEYKNIILNTNPKIQINQTYLEV